MKVDVSFVSLGCDKNLVDSEVMLGLVKNAGHNVISDESAADIIVINTCCFIKDALEESIETIIEMGEYKRTGSCKGIIVAGCLGQRYEKEIFEELPEVDAVIGTTAFETIADAIDMIMEGTGSFKTITDINKPMDDANGKVRILSTAGYYAYLKISEGCDNHCTYCIIPKLRGAHRSRALPSLLEEARILAEKGVKELIIVAQDTSIYGRDIYGEPKLHVLLAELCKIDGIEWIRLLYCYPETLTDETISVMSKEEKICKYIDLPIQHANDNILKKMGRRSSQKLLRETIGKLRESMPDLAVRTSLIVGFPGETQEEFEDLMNFVSDMEFERLGVFTYSREEGTPAAKLAGQIDEEVKEDRKTNIMELQKTISAGRCESFIGKVFKVLVEGKLPGEDVYCARTYMDAPDIDGLVFIDSGYDLITGDFVDVLIKEASDYDLYGEVYYGNESS